MYCVKCGVELMKGETACPLCGTAVYHPDIKETPDRPTYPSVGNGTEKVSPGGLMFIITFLFAVPAIICLLTDFSITRSITWSDYAALGLTSCYLIFCLPMWFRRPNPVIFFPCDVAVVLLLLLYINLKTGSHWFLSFAFPVGGLYGLIIETVIVLARYTVKNRRHRYLYILGGAVIASGCGIMLIEFLLKVTFGLGMRFWSVIPLSALLLLGMMLIIIAIVKPLRESLHKKFFI